MTTRRCADMWSFLTEKAYTLSSYALTHVALTPAAGPQARTRARPRRRRARPNII